MTIYFNEGKTHAECPTCGEWSVATDEIIAGWLVADAAPRLLESCEEMLNWLIINGVRSEMTKNAEVILANVTNQTMARVYEHKHLEE